MEPLFLGKVFGKLRGQLPVDDEFKVIPPGNEMNVVPLTLSNVFFLQSILDLRDGRFVILVDHQTVTPKAPVLLTAGGMKIPSSHNLLAHAHSAQVRMVALKIPTAAGIYYRPDADAAIGLGTRQPVAQLQFEVTDFSILHVSEVTAPALVSVPANHPVPDHPCILDTRRNGAPTLQALAVEDRNESVALVGSQGQAEGEKAEVLDPFHQFHFQSLTLSLFLPSSTRY